MSINDIRFSNERGLMRPRMLIVLALIAAVLFVTQLGGSQPAQAALSAFQEGTSGSASGTCGTPGNSAVSDDSRSICDDTQTIIIDGFGLDAVPPAGAADFGFIVQIEALLVNDDSTDAIAVDLSWDGGTSFTTSDPSVAFNQSDGTEATLTTGSCSSFGRTWTAAELSNTNFRVRLVIGTNNNDGLQVDDVDVALCYSTRSINNVPDFDEGASTTVGLGDNVEADVQTAVSSGIGSAWEGTKYQVEGQAISGCVNTSDSGSGLEGNFTVNDIDITAPGVAGSYDVTFWAYADDACTLGESAPRTFANAIVVNAAPGAPTPLTPTGTIGDTTPTFTWTAVTDPESDSFQYDLQVTQDCGGGTPWVSGVTTFSTASLVNPPETIDWPNAALANGAWCWRVRAVDAGHPSVTYSSQLNFTVSNSAPPTPDLVSPANNSNTSDLTPTFDWTDEVDPDGDPVTYTIQANLNACDFGGTLEINTSSLVPSTFTPGSNLAQGSYCWRVRASDNQGNNSNWSAEWVVNVFTQTANPPPPESCGVDIVIIMDRSGSIDDGEEDDMQTAFNGFVDAFLPGTPTFIGLVNFSDNATVAVAFTNVAATLHTAINVNNTDGFTNWDQALMDARNHFSTQAANRLTVPDLIIFATDGDPTISGDPGAGSNTAQPNQHLTPAVAQANLAKGAGIRIVSIGISDQNPFPTDSLARLQLISGPGAGDVVTSNFDDLAANLAAFALEQCGGTVQIHKTIDADGDKTTTGDQSDGAGWDYTVPDFTGGTAPTPDPTDVNGNTEVDVDFDDDDPVTLNVYETVETGYTLFDVDCTKNALDVGTYDGDPGDGDGAGIEDLVLSKLQTITCIFYNTPKATPTVTTTIHAGDNHDDGVTSVPAGSDVHDSASVTGSEGTPTGNVTFTWFLNGDCTPDGAPAGTVALDGNGIAHPSATFGPLNAGSYSFQAHYAGDENYTEADSLCEPLDVTQLTPTVVTTIHEGTDHATGVTSVDAGSTVHDGATVSGSFGTPTGTVTFSWFTNDDCSPTGAAGTPITIVAGVAHPSASQGPLNAGDYSFKAHYNGSTNYAEADSDCEPLTVTQLTPTVVTTIHEGTDHATGVTSVDAGSTVHDSATVSGSFGTPTGDVTFTWFTNGTCTPDGTDGSPITLVAGVAHPSASQGPLTAGDYSFQAHYAGDTNYIAGDSDCEPLEVTLITPTVTTTIHEGTDHATGVTSVDAGSTVHDSATVSGSAGTPTGDVTFTWFTNGDCTPDGTDGTPITLAAGVAHPSASQGPLDAGDYSFKAHYNGNGTYAEADSECEPLTVTQLTPTVVTTIHEGADHATGVTSVDAGSTVHDSATVSGAFGTPTGNVTFSFYTDAGCDGGETGAGIVALNGSGVAHPSDSQGPLNAGSRSFKAHYAGDTNYVAADSECEPLTITQLTPTVTTTIHEGADHATSVTSVDAGSTVHDSATVSGSGPTPTGTVTFTWFKNGTCDGNGTPGNAINVVAGVAHPSVSQGPLNAGNYSFQASYSGDVNYVAGDSACEPLEVTKLDPGITTTIHNGDDHATSVTSVIAGSTVHDSATVSGAFGTPTGDVTFAWYTNGTCTPDGTDAGTVALAAGVAHPSSSFGPLAEGSYSFQAHYNGDDNYNEATSDCEPLTVTEEEELGVNVTKDADDDVLDPFGQVVEFTVTITNTSNEPVVITSLTDDDFGDLLNGGNADVISTNCDNLDGDVLAPDESTSCTFTAFIEQTSPAPHENTVTVVVREEDGDDEADDSDTVVLPFEEVPPPPPTPTTPPTVTSTPVTQTLTVRATPVISETLPSRLPQTGSGGGVEKDAARWLLILGMGAGAVGIAILCAARGNRRRDEE